MQIVFIPTIRPDLIPSHHGDHLPRECQIKAQNAVNRWTEFFGDEIFSFIEGADFEDWHEQANILFAALDSDLPVHAFIEIDERTNKANFVGLPPRAGMEPTIVLGNAWHARTGLMHRAVQGLNVVWPILEQIQDAARYDLNFAFPKLAGRHCMSGSSCSDEFPAGTVGSVSAAVQHVARKVPGEELLLKCMSRVKYSQPRRVEFTDIENPHAIERQLMAALEWDYVHCDGMPHFLVQQIIPMEHEYRLIVINGRIVCGAGCIEDYTPLNHLKAFDSVTERVRGKPETRVSNSDRVSAYIEFGIKCVLNMQSALGRKISCTLDVAMNDQGKPVLIEANPACNFGLYANDFAAILDEIIDFSHFHYIASAGLAAIDRYKDKIVYIRSEISLKRPDAFWQEMANIDIKLKENEIEKKKTFSTKEQFSKKNKKNWNKQKPRGRR